MYALIIVVAFDVSKFITCLSSSVIIDLVLLQSLVWFLGISSVVQFVRNIN